MQAGIQPSDFADTLRSLDKNEAQKQTLLLQKKFNKIKNLPIDKIKNRLYSYASRNNFSIVQAKKIIDDLLSKG